MAADPSQQPLPPGSGPPMGPGPPGPPMPPPEPPPGMVSEEMQHDAPVPPTPGPSLGELTETLAQASKTTAEKAMAADNPQEAKDFATAAMNLAQGLAAVNPPQKPVDPNIHAPKPVDPMQMAQVVAEAHKQAAEHAQQARSQLADHAQELTKLRQDHAQQLERAMQQQQAQAEQAQQEPQGGE